MQKIKIIYFELNFFCSVLWSKPIPLGWYFGAQWERAHGKNWPRALCDNWLKKDRYLQNFAAELPICPCKLGKICAIYN